MNNYTRPKYGVWKAMNRRCSNPMEKDRKRYAGVRVCDRWRKFENFLADVGERPSRAHSLDRFPDKEGDYEPGNVRWATPLEQGNNKTNNRLLTFEGRTLSLAQWARETGIKETTLTARIKRCGWPAEKALTTPVHSAAPRQRDASAGIPPASGTAGSRSPAVTGISPERGLSAQTPATAGDV